MLVCNRALLLVVASAIVLADRPLQDAESKPVAKASAEETKAFEEKVPGTTATLKMVPIPKGKEDEKAFYMSATEITWDIFDVFVFGLDENSAPKEVDAYSRPSKPYIPPDKGFGHAGYPAIGMSFKNATEFSKWLAAKTGKKYRLPTESEWERACRAGTTTAYFTGNDATGIADHVWFKDNAANKTQPVGKKKPNAWGLHDMLGNVAEWTVGKDGKGTTCGGSFQDEAKGVVPTARQPFQKAWNASDPQVPKSKFWMVDCAHVGFRVVLEG